jgi:hypothetical protein
MLNSQTNAFYGIENLINKLISYGLLTTQEEQQAKQHITLLETAFDTEYMQFLNVFNEITGKKYAPDQHSRELFYGNHIHTLDQKITALRNAAASSWIQDNTHVLTPKFILKKENIAKYMNYSENLNTQENGTNNNSNEYAEAQNL